MPVNSDYKVSVIVPVYNVEQYLSDCLESICRQTLKGIEIIVVNDGSTYKSLSIIKSFQQKYSNIKLINKKNGGLSSARNAGIDMAVGEYLFFVDSDDFIDLDTLEKMYVKAKETHCPLIICGILQYWSDNKKKLYKKCISDKESIYDADLLYKLQLSGRMGCQCCNKLYKREIWISHSLRFREGDYYEDIEMAFKVVQAYQQAYIMNSPYYKYRMRQNSIVVSTNKKIIKDFINNTNAVLSMVRCECIDYQCFIEAFKVNAFIYTVKLLSKLRDDDAYVCYDLCKNVYADIKLWNVMSNSKLLFRNKIQYIWYIDIVLACKLLNFR